MFPESPFCWWSKLSHFRINSVRRFLTDSESCLPARVPGDGSGGHAPSSRDQIPGVIIHPFWCQPRCSPLHQVPDACQLPTLALAVMIPSLLVCHWIPTGPAEPPSAGLLTVSQEGKERWLTVECFTLGAEHLVGLRHCLRRAVRLPFFTFTAALPHQQERLATKSVPAEMEAQLSSTIPCIPLTPSPLSSPLGLDGSLGLQKSILI